MVRGPAVPAHQFLVLLVQEPLHPENRVDDGEAAGRLEGRLDQAQREEPVEAVADPVGLRPEPGGEFDQAQFGPGQHLLVHRLVELLLVERHGHRFPSWHAVTPVDLRVICEQPACRRST